MMSSDPKLPHPPATDTREAQLRQALEMALEGAPRAPEAKALVNGSGLPPALRLVRGDE